MARKMYRMEGLPVPPYPMQDEDFFAWAIKPNQNVYLVSFLKDCLNEIARESYDRDFESLKSNLYRYGKNNPVQVNGQNWYDYYRDDLTDEFLRAFLYPPTPSVDWPDIDIEEPPIDDDLELEEYDPYGQNPLLGGGSGSTGSTGRTTGQDAATASEPANNVGTTENGTGTQASGGGNRNGGGTKVVRQKRTVYPSIPSVHLRPYQIPNKRPSYSVDLQNVPVTPYIDDEALYFIRKPKKGRKQIFKNK